MVGVADFLDEKLKEIEGRMRELRPAAQEYAKLERAAKVLSEHAKQGPVNGRRKLVKT